MPLPIPNLDDLTWGDLLEEGRSLIPAYAPEWTDYNPSDPGITLMELFAYVTDMLLYRVDQISDRHINAYLRLMNGPDWRPGPNLDESIRWTVSRLRRPERAVTAKDYEIIASEVVGVGRAVCSPGRNLTRGRGRERLECAPGHVSVIVLPRPEVTNQARLIQQVRERLETVRLVGTRVHVSGPRTVHIRISVDVVLEHGEVQTTIAENIQKELDGFYDPIAGGPEGKGYPLGRNVYISEIYQVLENLPGVDYIQRRVDKAGKPLDEVTVSEDDSWRLRRNSVNELEAVVLDADELSEVQMERARRK